VSHHHTHLDATDVAERIGEGAVVGYYLHNRANGRDPAEDGPFGQAAHFAGGWVAASWGWAAIVAIGGWLLHWVLLPYLALMTLIAAAPALLTLWLCHVPGGMTPGAVWALAALGGTWWLWWIWWSLGGLFQRSETSRGNLVWVWPYLVTTGVLCNAPTLIWAGAVHAARNDGGGALAWPFWVLAALLFSLWVSEVVVKRGHRSGRFHAGQRSGSSVRPAGSPVRVNAVIVESPAPTQRFALLPIQAMTVAHKPDDHRPSSRHTATPLAGPALSATDGDRERQQSALTELYRAQDHRARRFSDAELAHDPWDDDED
jgi:hypothetical protein